MEIAKIVSSNSHVAYVARVLDERDGEGLPPVEEYGFGRFVAVDCDDERIVGVIFDSRLVNPEYSFTPRLAQTPALGDLRRDVADEQKTLVGIMLLGSIRDGVPAQEIPKRILPAGKFVESMPAAEVAEFHRDGGGAMRMHYLPGLLSQSGPLAVPLAKTVISHVEPHCSEADRQRLGVMLSSLSWRHTFGDTRF